MCGGSSGSTGRSALYDPSYPMGKMFDPDYSLGAKLRSHL